MSRALTIGNGNILVGIDERGLVRDFYYPYVGHSNHVSGASGSYVHRVGVWVDGKLSSLEDTSWSSTVSYARHSGTGTTRAEHKNLGISLVISDTVHHEKNVFIRKVTVTNNNDAHRNIKLFFGQEFRISESRRGDTAFYDPRVNAIIHYKGHNAFLVYASHLDVPFVDYSVGLFDIEGKSGTWKDTEDGVLSMNPIEHGSVDSVLGFPLALAPHECASTYYWIAVGGSIPDVHALHAHILRETPERIIGSTERYWRSWIEKDTRDLSMLEGNIADLYTRSLSVVRAHVDNRGGIIASSDSTMLNQGRDSYAYVWPRDASIIANALDRAGHTDVTRRFFTYMAERLEAGGYLMHKYRVDGVLGSSWHPWIEHGVPRLPIQEDETATVLFMLREHYAFAKDLEFIENLYTPFIERAANFLESYIDTTTDLPLDSYDLWEEKYGSSTYTASSVYGALLAAADFSALLGKRENATRYQERAERIKNGILSYLFDAQSGTFVKLVRHDDAGLFYDKTIDMSSIFGIVFFGVLDVSDKRVITAHKNMIERLTVPTHIGGYMRYENDAYYRTGSGSPSNPWCITSLWVARHLIKTARSRKELEKAHTLLQWTTDRASYGLLPEQTHPHTGEPLSATPLIWSHAEFIIAVDEYSKKYNQLS